MSRVIHTLNMFDRVAHLPGDVMECGVAAGVITFPLAVVAMERNPKKVVYACDTFAGLPYDDQVKNEGMEMKKGECNYGKSFKNLYAIWPHRQNIVMVEGLVEETLPAKLSDKTFCFVWLDMDCYQPTSFATKFLEDRMVVGGIIGWHDYRFPRCPGIEIVVDDELNHGKYQKVHQWGTCVYYQRVR